MTPGTRCRTGFPTKTERSSGALSSSSASPRWRSSSTSGSSATPKVPALEVATRYTELGDALLPLINPALRAKYGLEMPSFILENVSVPPDVEAAIDKRSSMAAVGNLTDYVKYQMAQGLEKGGAGV